MSNWPIVNGQLCVPDVRSQLCFACIEFRSQIPRLAVLDAMTSRPICMRWFCLIRLTFSFLTLELHPNERSHNERPFWVFLLNTFSICVSNSWSHDVLIFNTLEHSIFHASLIVFFQLRENWDFFLSMLWPTPCIYITRGSSLSSLHYCPLE